ncbi:hypothetical protein [Burkholderia sp. BE17]|uniref:hypothetical protein n=1 Tax=Burkholderia sp. BE17 TaxID=2656644 RepID=UPI00128C7DE0|nr:hypothetical protein [Burkholderia sp. BE17]MPV71491.1 hypothetical protein [Burkholderia sp. BE17]
MTIQALATLVHSIRPNPAQAAPLSGTRQYLHEATAGHSQPFGKAVYATNQNLGTWGDDAIPHWKARSYAHDAASVERGESSNSHAFAKSALQWASEGNLAGTVLNTCGMLASGAIDHQNRYRLAP